MFDSYIKKEQLKENGYQWPVEEEINYNGMDKEPTRRAFNRNDGEHLLYMINYFMKSTGNLLPTDAHRIETLIADKMPLGLKSEISVYNWLREAYNHKPVN